MHDDLLTGAAQPFVDPAWVDENAGSSDALERARMAALRDADLPEQFVAPLAILGVSETLEGDSLLVELASIASHFWDPSGCGPISTVHDRRCLADLVVLHWKHQGAPLPRHWSSGQRNAFTKTLLLTTDPYWESGEIVDDEPGSTASVRYVFDWLLKQCRGVIPDADYETLMVRLVIDKDPRAMRQYAALTQPLVRRPLRWRSQRRAAALRRPRRRRATARTSARAARGSPGRPGRPGRSELVGVPA